MISDEATWVDRYLLGGLAIPKVEIAEGFIHFIGLTYLPHEK